MKKTNDNTKKLNETWIFKCPGPGCNREINSKDLPDDEWVVVEIDGSLTGSIVICPDHVHLLITSLWNVFGDSDNYVLISQVDLGVTKIK